MAVINNAPPAQVESSNGGWGFFLGVVLLILFFLGLLYYGFPLLQSLRAPQTPSVNVPGKIDVNVNNK